MAGLMNWFWDKVGLGDPEEDTDDVAVEDEVVQDALPPQPRTALNNVVPMPSKNAAAGVPATRSFGQQSTEAPEENGNRQLMVFTPHKYDELPKLVKHLLNGVPVIVSFEGLSEGEMRPMLDFIFGATCALNGTAQKISGFIFVVAPSNVDVMSNMKEMLLARDTLVRNYESRLSVQDDDNYTNY